MTAEPGSQAGVPALAESLDAVLPQTQCTRCGYRDCLSYAQAMAAGEAPINRCPPGGEQTLARLAELTGARATVLDPDCGRPGPRQLARVDESWCIGCTRCIKACPVDAIVGAPRRMHVVIQSWCTGCELCLPPCPVECIDLIPDQHGPSSPGQWLEQRAGLFRARYRSRQVRLSGLAREGSATPDTAPDVPRSMSSSQRRQAILQAVARTRATRVRDPA